MRSNRFVPLVPIAIAALALAPSSASAQRTTQRSARPCRIHLEVPSAPISAGESATIFGSLLCPKSVAPGGRQVTFYEHAATTPGFVSLGTTTSEADGAFQLTPPALETNSVFYAVAEGATSARRTIRVTAQITATAPTPAEGAQLFTAGGRPTRVKNAVTFAGTVGHADSGARVVLQREASTANEEWRRIGVGSVGPNGEYAIVHHFHVPGDANIRVVVRPRKVNVAAATTPLSYEISQTENPQLTISTTADPLAYTQPATISGTLAGAAPGTPVTLLAHTLGTSFEPVATTDTGAGGAYSFAPQTPLKNTSYRVKAGKTSSSVLFEGVKYGLAVAPSPSAVAAGQPLTITGDVLPALVGHVVYLEKQGSLKLGWHVIDVGTIGAAGAPGQPAPFSIAHAFYAPGSERLRIKVPGDPGNQGIASPPFEVTVTPTAASALAPQAPGNSRLPVEGQV
jgi:hypothetical protein